MDVKQNFEITSGGKACGNEWRMPYLRYTTAGNLRPGKAKKCNEPGRNTASGCAGCSAARGIHAAGSRERHYFIEAGHAQFDRRLKCRAGRNRRGVDGVTDSVQSGTAS